MSVLTKKEILEYINDGRLVFAPALDGFQLQPHAVDLRLGHNFRVPKTWEITSVGRTAIKINGLSNGTSGNNYFEEINLRPGQHFELLPHEVVIAETLEEIAFNSGQVMAVLYPRSSLNRRGLSVDLSGIVDVKYKGHLIIPIRNNTNQIIELFPGERICQLTFNLLCSEISEYDASIHGLEIPKYTRVNESKYKMDKQEEREYLLKGDIQGLKERFKI